MNNEASGEPWVPAGLAALLVPGARVRIRISPECPMDPEITWLYADRLAAHRALDGSTGVIMSLPYALLPTHPFPVRVDRPMGNIGGGWFAAAELDPYDVD